MNEKICLEMGTIRITFTCLQHLIVIECVAACCSVVIECTRKGQSNCGARHCHQLFRFLNFYLQKECEMGRRSEHHQEYSHETQSVQFVTILHGFLPRQIS